MNHTILASGSFSDGGAAAVLVIVLIAFYFIPTIIATLRHVPNVGSVAIINIFLGWTFIGWVVAMAMAMRSGAQSTIVNVHTTPGYYTSAPQQSAPGAPAGWYPDPHGAAGQRYWDGRTWTAHTS